MLKNVRKIFFFLKFSVLNVTNNEKKDFHHSKIDGKISVEHFKKSPSRLCCNYRRGLWSDVPPKGLKKINLGTLIKSSSLATSNFEFSAWIYWFYKDMCLCIILYNKFNLLSKVWLELDQKSLSNYSLD